MLSQHGSFFVEQRRCIWRPYAIVSLVLLITFLAWDSTAWDMYLESIWGEPSGFSLRDQWWMAKIMHEGAHNLGWGGYWPFLLASGVPGVHSEPWPHPIESVCFYPC